MTSLLSRLGYAVLWLVGFIATRLAALIALVFFGALLLLAALFRDERHFPLDMRN